jgi:hypothetical protein
MSGLNTRHRGHVKFFNSVKGYGFILPEEPNEDNTEGILFFSVSLFTIGLTRQMNQ